MDISIVIVNYNVKYFLEQCLKSIYNSQKNLKIEVFVVDNNSVDGSSRMVKENFPEVVLIQNYENVGFARANNQALKLCKGKYVLILNPDTILQEDTLVKCYEFMENNPEAGALSVKMINGKGKFLPESKRGLPTPEVAFYKMFGFNKIFPHSKRFNKYYLGHLDNDSIHEIEILPGAFMFIRKSVLDIVGFFDEDFFMYGEDIDLSYRILKAGYKNYYFPLTKIIHYKGESTKKGSFNYVMVFYQAMLIFSKKHFSNKYIKIFNFLINLAIYFRGFLSILKRIFLTLIYPTLIFCISFLLYKAFLKFWSYFYFGSYNYYPVNIYRYVIPTLIAFWLFVMYISGSLNKRSSFYSIIRGIILGLIFILVIYSLFPANLRFSRVAVIMGSVFILFSVIVSRLFLKFIFPGEFNIPFIRNKKKVIVVGLNEEFDKVKRILNMDSNIEVVGVVSPDDNFDEKFFMGGRSQLTEIVRIYDIDEIIFCGANVPASGIIDAMLELSDYSVEFKILPPDSFFIVGTNSVVTYEDLYTLPLESIFNKFNRTKKRIFDVSLSLFLLIIFPFVCLYVKNKLLAIKNLIKVLTGKYTFIGFNFHYDNKFRYLLKPSLLSPLDVLKNDNSTLMNDKQIIYRVLFNYLKNYSIKNDILILIKGLKNIDKRL